MPVIPTHVCERIAELLRQRKNSNQIQKEVGHRRSVILNIYRKMKKGLGVENESQTGRPTKLFTRSSRKVVVKSKKSPFSTARELRTACS